MNRARLIALGFVATLLLPIGASAANEGPDRTGPYASLSFALGYDQFELEGLGDFGTGMGIDVRGGYRLHRWLAAELEFDFLHFDDTELGVDHRGRMYLATANAKIPLLSGPLQPYVLGGVGVLHADIDTSTMGGTHDTGFAGKAGGGIDLYLNDYIVLTTDVTYVGTTGAVDDRDRIDWKLGLAMRF
jgi:opacity protein-like surface antigen